jgi:hypothetical protein
MLLPVRSSGTSSLGKDSKQTEKMGLSDENLYNSQTKRRLLSWNQAVDPKLSLLDGSGQR